MWALGVTIYRMIAGKIPKFKGKKYKSDSKTLKSFGKDYFEACDYIGFFDIK